MRSAASPRELTPLSMTKFGALEVACADSYSASVLAADGRPLSGFEVAECLVLDRKLVRKLIALARSRFGIGETDAEDLVQETALEIARSPALIASPDGYAFQVFHNRCVRFLDRRTRDSAALAEASCAAPAPAGSRQLDEKAIVRAGFARISPTCRALLTSYYVEGASLKETAARSGHSPKTVWKRLSACLAKLKEAIGA